VTLVPDVDLAALLVRIDASPGCSIKDSFGTLDLAPLGFEVLVDARWIGRAPEPVSPASVDPDAALVVVADAATLASWERTWRGADGPAGLFRPTLLRDPDVVILAATHGPHVTAGAVLSCGGGVVGVSNVFGPADRVDAVWDGAIRAAADRFPGAEVVGYELGDALATAERAGFTTLGPLRVWRRDVA
jgi:hypothetical protein